MPRFPRPGMGTIAQAVTGTRNTGLSIPMIQIDPRFNFVQGTAVYAGNIDKLGMSFSSFKEPLRESLNEVIIPSIRKNFISQGRPAWKKLKQSTVQSRLRQGFSRGPILDRTGRLKREATRKNIWEIKPLPGGGSAGSDFLRLRTIYFDQKVPYAVFHQIGARMPTNFRTRGLKGTIKSAGTNFVGSSFKTTYGPTQYEPEGRNWILPARPYIKLTIQEEVDIYNIFVSFMNDKVNKHWGPGSMGL